MKMNAVLFLIQMFYCAVTNEDCDRTYDASEAAGSFTSANYPGEYPDSLNCITKIYAKSGCVIRINTTEIYIENHSSCDYDYLEVNKFLYYLFSLIWPILNLVQ